MWCSRIFLRIVYFLRSEYFYSILICDSRDEGVKAGGIIAKLRSVKNG